MNDTSNQWRGPLGYGGLGWIILLGFWTVPGLLLASQIYFSFDMEGQTMSWWRLVVWQVPGWYFWAAATPLIFRLTRRVPVARGRWLTAGLTHLGAALLAALTRTSCSTRCTPSPCWYARAPTRRRCGCSPA